MPKSRLSSSFLFFFVSLLAAALVYAGKFEDCKRDCRRVPDETASFLCVEACKEKYGSQPEGNKENSKLQIVEEEEGEEFREGKPFLFDEQHFQTLFETDHGKVRLLQNFAQRSNLLAGLLNYRVAILEANPSTFIAPAHVDAEALFFVPEGKLTINLIRQDKRQTFNLKKGDIIRVPSGTTVYLINTSKTKKLVVVKLFLPVSNPGHFSTFFGLGGQNPESSFINVFSPELLEAAYNAEREKVKRVFGTKTGGRMIVKASQQQIRAMSQREMIRPFFREEEGAPFNLFEKPATSHSNQYGKLVVISANDNQDLRKLNVGVSYANITKGAMIGPLFSSKAIKIVIVVRGKGYFEMASPDHDLSQSGHEQQPAGTSRYVRVSGKLQKGVVFVVLPGRPVITVSDGSENLELLCLEVNDLENEAFLLAGKKNILSLLEKTALELSLGGVPEEESREVVESQTDYLFFKGPNSQEQQQQEDGFATTA